MAAARAGPGGRSAGRRGPAGRSRRRTTGKPSAFRREPAAWSRGQRGGARLPARAGAPSCGGGFLRCSLGGRCFADGAGAAAAPRHQRQRRPPRSSCGGTCGWRRSWTRRHACRRRRRSGRSGSGCGGARLVLPVVDVPGVNFFFVVEAVVGFGFVGTRLAEDFAAKRVREERLHVGRVGGYNQVQQVCGRRVVGDEVGRGFADPKVEDLHVAGTLARGDFPGALGHLIRVVRARPRGCSQHG